MKVVQINTTCGIGSTGKICVDISKLLTENNIENYILYSNKSNGYELGISCSTRRYTKLQALKSHVLGNYGFNSRIETKRMIQQLESIKPDIVHLHNIHGHDCQLEMLFQYLKKSRIKLVWTFHDCWAFTGYCPHFAMVKCDKWRYECEKCPQYREYSFLVDNSKKLYLKKKEALKGLDMTIVTPSQWLADIVKQSFVKQYPITVLNNGIDLSIFKPSKSNFKEKYNIPSYKKIILGVAFDWGIRKGLDVCIDLMKFIDKEKYQLVLVGTDENIDKQLSTDIISIHRTHSQIELAQIYSVADVFINPTREENFPTVNMEAIACGTPVVTFKTGGSPEIITDETGLVVNEKTSEAIFNAIETICNDNRYSEVNWEKCSEKFDKTLKYQEYLELYRKIYNTK